METRQESNCHQTLIGKGHRSSAHDATGRTLDSQKALGHYLADQRDLMQMSLDQIARTTKIPKSSLEHLEAGRFGKLPGDVFVRGFLRSYARCVQLDGDEVVRRYAQCGLMPAPVSSELAESILARKRRTFAGGTQAPTTAGGTQAPTTAGGTQAPTTAGGTRAPTTTDDQAELSIQAKGDAVRHVLRDAFDLGKQHLAKRVADTQAAAAERKLTAQASESPAKPESQVAAPEERVRTFIPPSFNFDDEMSRRGPLTLGVIILVIVATLTMSYLLRRPGTSTDGFTMLDTPARTTETPALAPSDSFSL